MASFFFGSRASTPTTERLPGVRIEVRHGKSSSSSSEMTREEFLIGAAAGCELRLPGTGLPPVVCILLRKPDGVKLRKVAQNTPVLLNGQPVSNSNLAVLNQGDTITIGRTDILLNIDQDVPAPQPILPPETPPAFTPPVEEAKQPEPVPPPAPPKPSKPALSAQEMLENEFRIRHQELQARERKLHDAQKELENDRILWYRRREEMEKEHQQSRAELEGDVHKRKELEDRYAVIEKKHVELADWRDKLANHQSDIERMRLELQQQRHELQEREKVLSEDWEERRKVLESEIDKRRQEIEEELTNRRTSLEAELAQRREQAEAEWRIWIEQKDTGYSQFRAQLEADFYEKYRKRGEELDRFQLSIREAAVQLREQRNMHDDQIRQFEPRWQELLKRESEIEDRIRGIESRYEEWKQSQAALDAEQKAWQERYLAKESEWQERWIAKENELTTWEFRLKEREAAIDRDAESVEELKAKFRTNLVRLGELQLELDAKDKDLAARAAEIDSHFEKYRADAGTFESQARELDDRREKILLEETVLYNRMRDLQDRESVLNTRIAQLETQQAMLANLRNQLEREREEFQKETARIADERLKQDSYLKEARDKLREAELLRESLADQTLSVSEGQKVFAERSEMMRQAMMQLRALQDQLADQDTGLRRREEELARRKDELAEEAALWKARTAQLNELQHKLDEDRASLRVRENELLSADEPRRILQEQLRRRSDELAQQQKELGDKAQQLEDQTKLLQEQADALESLRADAIAARQISESHFAELAKKDEQLRQQSELLRQAETTIEKQKNDLAEVRAILSQDRRLTAEQTDEAYKKLSLYHTDLTSHAAELRNSIPEFEQRIQGSLEKTNQVRDQLRGQLSELHSYARQSQEELQAIRDQLSSEVEKLRQQEANLNRARTEHRHSVASFKQQLLEWQSRFSGLRQTIAQNQTQSAQKQAFIEVTTIELAHKSEEIEKERKFIAEKRGDVERHLKDMREWYRQKLRELVDGSRASDPEELDDHSILPMLLEDQVMPIRVEELDAGDRKLGEMLRTYDLVDSETLNALWTVARNSNKQLRQVLLASNALTVYQMALIEAGNINGLVLGRFRVIDRLPGTSREAQYKVYDPQGLADSRRSGPQGPEGICLLRHLAESEMQDAIRPDEYRERYRVARDLAHPNIRATYEVLDIAGRPAVLQEWLTGLPGDEWPALAAAPGVWFRLISQAGLALYTASQVGLHHGRIQPESFCLTADGMLKVHGFGEPNWIYGSTAEATEQGDLLALGQVAMQWADLNKRRKKFPESLQRILRRLGADGNNRELYQSAAELLDDLDSAGGSVPISGDAWEKLRENVEEYQAKETIKQSA